MMCDIITVRHNTVKRLDLWSDAQCVKPIFYYLIVILLYRLVRVLIDMYVFF